MNVISTLVLVAVAVVSMVFAVSNRQDVVLDLWPLPFDLPMPVYLAVLGALGIGFLIGSFLTGVSTVLWRSRAKGEHRHAEGAEREIERLRARIDELERTSESQKAALAALPAPGRRDDSSAA